MEINIITASGALKIDNVTRITIPNLDGQRTLLNKHSDTMIALGFGKGHLKVNDSKEKFVLSGGIASLVDNVFTIMPEHFSFSNLANYKYTSSNSFEGNPDFELLLETINETN